MTGRAEPREGMGGASIGMVDKVFQHFIFAPLRAEYMNWGMGRDWMSTKHHQVIYK